MKNNSLNCPKRLPSLTMLLPQFIILYYTFALHVHTVSSSACLLACLLHSLPVQRLLSSPSRQRHGQKQQQQRHTPAARGIETMGAAAVAVATVDGRLHNKRLVTVEFRISGRQQRLCCHYTYIAVPARRPSCAQLSLFIPRPPSHGQPLLLAMGVPACAGVCVCV